MFLLQISETNRFPYMNEIVSDVTNLHINSFFSMKELWHKGPTDTTLDCSLINCVWRSKLIACNIYLSLFYGLVLFSFFMSDNFFYKTWTKGLEFFKDGLGLYCVCLYRQFYPSRPCFRVGAKKKNFQFFVWTLSKKGLGLDT